MYDDKGYVIFDDLTMMRIKKFFKGYVSFMIQRRYLDFNLKVKECVIDAQCLQVQVILDGFNLKHRSLDQEQIEHVLYQIEHKIRTHIDTVIPRY